MLFFHILPNRKINTVCPQFCYFSTSPFVWTRIYGRTLIKAIIIICFSQMPTTYFAYRQHGRSSICCTLRYTLSPPHGYLNAGPHSDTGKKSTWQGSLMSLFQVAFLDIFNVWLTKNFKPVPEFLSSSAQRIKVRELQSGAGTCPRGYRKMFSLSSPCLLGQLGSCSTAQWPGELS